MDDAPRRTARGRVAARLRRRILADIVHGRQRPDTRMNLPRLAAQYGASTNAVRKALILPTGSGLIVRRAAPCRALQQRLSRYRNLATASGGDGDGEPLAALLATRDPVLARDLECSVGLLRTHYRLTASSLLASGALL